MDRWDRPTYKIIKPTKDVIVMELPPPPYTLWPFSSPLLSTEIMVVNMEYAISYAITTKYEYANFDLIEINNFLDGQKASNRCKFYFGSDVMNRFNNIDIYKRVWKKFLLPVDEIIVEGDISFTFLEMFMQLFNAPSTFICRCISFPLNDSSIFRHLPTLPGLVELHFNYRVTQKPNMLSNLIDLRDNYREHCSLNVLNLAFSTSILFRPVSSNGSSVGDPDWDEVIKLVVVTLLVDTKRTQKWEKQIYQKYHFDDVGYTLDGLADNVKRYEILAAFINGRLYRFLWMVDKQ